MMLVVLLRRMIMNLCLLTNSLFDARTALLCLHNSGVEMNRTQRIGTFSSFASDVQYSRVSMLALVLSVGGQQGLEKSETWAIIATHRLLRISWLRGAHEQP